MPTKTARTMRKTTKPAGTAKQSKSRLLPWMTIRGRIYGKGLTLTQFAQGIGCHPNALRMAAKGKCPNVLRDMQARLGSLAA